MTIRKQLAAVSAAALLGAPSAHAQDGASTSKPPYPPRECGDRGRLSHLEVIGLTRDQRLICFREDLPHKAWDIGALTGLLAAETLVGIDFRPSNGVLYGLGSKGGVYTIDPASAVAVQVAALNSPSGPLLLTGTSFGIDFNPVPDLLRVVSDSGENLRVNVQTGVAIADSTLSIPPAAAPALGVTAVAYTNGDADPATLTVLYDVDTTSDRLNIQIPPNAGTLTAVGALRVDSAADTGFDIYSALDSGGSTLRNKALGALSVDGVSRFYGIDLDTGRSAALGRFSARNRVTGIAIPPGQR
jgi:hypothetical protein